MTECSKMMEGLKFRNNYVFRILFHFDFCHLIFEFVLNFEIGISGLKNVLNTI